MNLKGIVFAAALVLAPGLATADPVTVIPNDGSTGTGAGLIAKANGAGAIRTITTADATASAAFLGICVANCGTAGSATLALGGQVGCVFDNSTTAGHYVVASTTAAGKCHDAGASLTSVPLVGVVQSTGSAGLHNVALTLAQGAMNVAAASAINLNAVWPLPVDPSGAATFSVGAADGGQTRMALFSFAALGGYDVYRSGGTLASPTTVPSNTNMGSFKIGGYDGSAWAATFAFNCVSAESWTTIAHGTSCRISTTPVGTITTSQVLQLFASGGVGVGASTVDPGINAFSTNATVIGGTPPTNSGACAINTQVGGNTAGSFKANGACAASTVILTFATTAPTGWECKVQDMTTPADAMNQTAYTTTSCTLTGTMAAADQVTFRATGF